jgi:transcriptional regulator with XRE-family HTH domain
MLKQFRLSRKMSQQHFANYLGIPRSTYQSYESGRRNPTPETKQYIEAAMRRFKAYEMGCLYHEALTRFETKPKPSFLSKRKLLKLSVFILLILILTVLW